MSWYLALSTAVLFASATLLAVVGSIALRYRHAPSAKVTAFIIFIACAWSLAYAAELISVDLPWKLFFAKTQYLAIVSLPVAWLALALEYTDQRRWITLRNGIIAAIVPAITLLLAFTNPSGLIWRAVSLDTSGSFHSLSLTYGDWFWIHAAYAYGLIGLGMVILVRAAQNASTLSRGQIVALLVGIMAPLLGNVLYITRLSPIHGLDPTVYGFLITGLALLWGLLRSQFLDLVPIARHRIVEDMADGFLVLNTTNKIVDSNAAALRVMNKTPNEVIGKPIDSILHLRIHPGEGLEETAHTLGEVTVGNAGSQLTYETRVSPLTDQHGRLRGYVVLLSDSTEKKHIQEALEETIRQKDLAYRQALVYSSELNQEINARKSAEEALRALSHKIAEVQEAERRHLARELHDEIGQALTGLRFVLESGASNGSHKLDEGLEIINGLIQQVHDLSLSLRPTVLDDLGLLPALIWYIERYSSQRAIEVHFKHRGLDRRFAPGIETAVYRIVQEGLTNVSKYAKVDSVDVSIWTTENTLEVQIEDSGVGFDVAKALTPPNSSGLVGMKERVALLGGVFNVDSSPGEGTRLTAQLPLHQAVRERTA